MTTSPEPAPEPVDQRLPTTFRVARGETVRLPGDVSLHFDAHGHKSVHIGETSPLIIHGSVQRGTSAPAQFSVHVFVGETRRFELEGGLAFELLAHSYDDWMELRYLGAADPRR